ncbi:MAG: sensor histidine kinase [Magnetospiraceae bacterium]
MMAIPQAVDWPKEIRRTLILQATLIGLLAATVAVFILSSYYASERALDRINTYHLASAHLSADARAKTHSLLDLRQHARMAHDAAGASPDEDNWNNAFPNADFYILTDQISGILDLQAIYAGERFEFLTEKVGQQLAALDALRRHPISATGAADPATPLLKSLQVTLMQLERLHVFSHDALSADYAADRGRRLYVLFGLSFGGVLIGYFIMRRGLAAAAAVIRQQVETQEALKISEEQLRGALVDAERANQAKTEFLATMSHELRTPLNAIIGFSDLIKNQLFGALGSDKYREYAHDIGTSSKLLLDLINDILDLSAVEAGKKHLVIEDLDVDGIITDCQRIVEHGIAKKSIRFTRQVPKNVPPLQADLRAIKQILFNLLSNAVKYTPEQGEISVHVSLRDGRHEFTVADTGVGIPADKLPHILDPFVTADYDPYKAQEGSGLGLAIVKSLVDLHDGELQIDSDVGRGTRITISLPSQQSTPPLDAVES